MLQGLIGAKKGQTMNDMTRTDAVMAVMQVFDRLESAERSMRP